MLIKVKLIAVYALVSLCLFFLSFLLPFRLVKNLSRRQEGFVAAARLPLIRAESSREHSFRLRGKDMSLHDDSAMLSHSISLL